LMAILPILSLTEQLSMITEIAFERGAAILIGK